jgi:hypothetical protein
MFRASSSRRITSVAAAAKSTRKRRRGPGGRLTDTAGGQPRPIPRRGYRRIFLRRRHLFDDFVDAVCSCRLDVRLHLLEARPLLLLQPPDPGRADRRDRLLRRGLQPARPTVRLDQDRRRDPRQGHQTTTHFRNAALVRAFRLGRLHRRTGQRERTRLHLWAPARLGLRRR